VIAALIPIAAFFGTFAGTYAYERRSTNASDALRLVIALEMPNRLPSGAIVEVAIDGSAARRLTSEPDGVASALDLQPDWSGAAGRLVFARETYTTDGTGSVPKLYAQRDDTAEATRLTGGSDVDRYPAWSPDGATIAFSRDTNGAFEIFVMDADGANLRQLTTDNARFEESPAWSPDGRRIAYTSTAGQNGDLKLMNADGSGIAEAGIVCFKVTGTPAGAVVDRLAERGVVASVTPYATEYVRMGPCVANSPEDAESALRAVRSVV
jgi:hypothetical protein